MALTPKQERFVRQYMVDLNGAGAAVRAGYSKRTAKQIASELLGKPEIAEAIADAQAERAKRVEVKSDDVLRELLRIGLADIRQAFDDDGRLLPMHKMPEEIRRAVAGVEVEQLFEGRGPSRRQIGELVKVKFWDKPQTLTTLMRHLGLLKDKLEVEGALTLADLVPKRQA